MQGGEAIKSTLPSTIPGSNLRTSQQTVGPNWGSQSTEVARQPAARKTLPIDPGPEKSSSNCGGDILASLRLFQNTCVTTWWVITASVLTAVVVSELLESQSS